ncbi:MAG: MATE family efflux transporter [Porphyromonadaceae bacterium]|nr:MATE family efflux transporter [Porphyromonadaceae bacterium]
MTQSADKSRMLELGSRPVGKLLFKYSIPAVVGMVVQALYNIIDSMVIGHAIDDPNVVAGIAVTFPVMNLATALGMLIGAGSATRISIVLGQKDHRRAQLILGNSVQLTIYIGLAYITVFALFLDKILMLFGASPNTLPYAHEFLMWLLPGMVLMNLTFSYNNVMRATGYPRLAMYTNLLGVAINLVLAPTFLFGFKMGIRGAAIATDIAMLVTAIFVMRHFFKRDSEVHFERGIYRIRRDIIKSIIYIGLSPFLINVAGSVVNAIINNSLLRYGGDNAIAAVVVFNRYVTVFVFIIIGICQGMQPILGYNYGSGNFTRLFSTLKKAAVSATVVTVIGSAVGVLFPAAIASMFMQDAAQISCAVVCLRITALMFWIVGYQIVVTNFFQSLGMAAKSVFLSLTRQIIFMIPMLLILPPLWGLNGVWACFPVCDFMSAVVATVFLIVQVKRIRGQKRPLSC